MSTWSMRRTVGAVAVAGVIAGLGGAAIAAAAGGGHSFMDGGVRGVVGQHPAAASSPRVESAPGSLHGEYVVSNGDGGFVTLLSQTGRVTAISPTAVTARSEDGFVQTYVIREAAGAAKPPFLVDAEVTIEATRDGQTATVTTIRPPLTAVPVPPMAAAPAP